MNKKCTVAEFVADYVFREKKVSTVFSVTGGGAMFLNDAFGKHEKGRVVYNHHEQASAMAAVGFAKAINDFGVAVITTGCGCTNALTGLLDAWQDNVPVLFISGQVKRRDTSRLSQAKLRQLGVQELDIIPVVQSMTKFAEMVEHPEDIKSILEEACATAKSGRPGPVWIDIPLDVQGAVIQPDQLMGFNNRNDVATACDSVNTTIIEEALRIAERPLIIAGNGVRLSGTESGLREFIELNHIPVVFSYLSPDILESEHPLAIGRLGTKGDRAGNFAVQNADVILVLGCRLSVPLTGFEFNWFGRNAKIIVVDIDPEEHKKKTVRIDEIIICDLRNFFEKMNSRIVCDERVVNSWVDKCQKWKEQWPVHQPEYAKQSPLNLYEIVESFWRTSPDNTDYVSDAGSSYYVCSQALRLRVGQKYHTSGAQADMGFTLPAALGVCIAKPNTTVIGVTGDGSLQMNLQELQTMVHLQPNLKLVVWNNNGYLSIKATQSKFFSSRYSGSGPSSGVSMPDLEKLCDAFGLSYVRCSEPNQLDTILRAQFNADGPSVIELICQPEQEIVPNVSAQKLEDGRLVSKPLEDMYPFLDRKVFHNEIIVDPVNED